MVRDELRRHEEGEAMSPFRSIDEIKEFLPKARAAYEMQVEAVALEVTDIAKQISSSLGEVSIDELKSVIIREFTKRMMEPMIIEGKVKL